MQRQNFIRKAPETTSQSEIFFNCCNIWQFPMRKIFLNLLTISIIECS